LPKYHTYIFIYTYSNIYSYFFPKIYRILPGWKEWTYCNGLRESNIHVWLTARNMFLSKLDHEFLSHLSYLVCDLHHFSNLEEFRIAFGNNPFWDSTKSKSTMTTRISITIFHSVIPRIFNGTVYLTNILRNLEYIRPK